MVAADMAGAEAGMLAEAGIAVVDFPEAAVFVEAA
jgi:hypothetical protein